MKECSKSIARRLRDPNFARFYFRGDGVDIGGKPDPLTLRSIKVRDLEDGDAQFMAGVPDETFDFVHNSHCLEHIPEHRRAVTAMGRSRAGRRTGPQGAASR